MSGTERKPLTTIHRLDEIPEFTSEAEEHAFWASHELSDVLWGQAEPLAPEELPPPRPATIPVVIRLDEATLRRARALARQRGQSYQALLSELVAERLGQEDRRAGRQRPHHSSAG